MNLHFENQDPSIRIVQNEIWVIGFLKIEWYLAHLKAIGKMHHNLERAYFSTYIIVSRFMTKVFQRALQISKMWFGVAKCLVGDFDKMVEISWQGLQKRCVLYSMWLSFRNALNWRTPEGFNFKKGFWRSQGFSHFYVVPIGTCKYIILTMVPLWW